MLRRLFTAASVLSLLLCLASFAGVVRGRHFLGISFWRVDGWLATPASRAMVTSAPVMPIRCISVPWAWPAVAAAALPLVWVIRRLVLLARRRNPGLCLTCGYDLRASTGRCPECGTPIPSSQETQA